MSFHVMLLLTTMVILSRQDQPCQSSIQGLVLIQHVYLSFKTSDPLKCYHECTTDIKCQSLNYFQNTQICELNNRTAEMRPRYILVHESAIYLVNPNKTPIGSSRKVPAESCAEIRNARDSVSYWVIERGKLKQATCYMSSMPDTDLACGSYVNITDATRNVKYGNPHKTDKCDKRIEKKWYRLTGAAGVRMPTKCVKTQRCNTDASGWLSNPHPTIEQGIVKRKVCFHWNNDCCYWSTYIKVRKCGTFFIYQFNPTPNCQLRYCGENL